MQNYCGHCGAKLDEGAKVCGYCGTPIEREEPGNGVSLLPRIARLGLVAAIVLTLCFTGVRAIGSRGKDPITSADPTSPVISTFAPVQETVKPEAVSKVSHDVVPSTPAVMKEPESTATASVKTDSIEALWKQAEAEPVEGLDFMVEDSALRELDETEYLPIKESLIYLDTSGQPMESYSRMYSYDPNNRMVRVEAASSDNSIPYLEELRSYDEDGQLVSIQFFDETGDLDMYPDYYRQFTYAGIYNYPLTEYVYDAHGNIVTERGFSRDNMSLQEVNYEYDSNINLLYKRYNHYSIEYEYDGSNRLIYLYNPKSDVAQRTTYDESGNCIRRQWFIKRTWDSPEILDHYIDYEYDHDGNQILATFYDSDSKITGYSKDFYSKQGYLIQEINTVTSTSYPNDASQPVVTNGIVKYVFEYDQYGNQVKETYYNMEGNKDYCVEREYTKVKKLPQPSYETTTEANNHGLFDHILCEGGDGYMLVCKKNETVTDSWVEVGVLDRENNWVVPMSRDGRINPDGDLYIFAYTYEEQCEEVREHLQYLGNGLVILSYPSSRVKYLYNIRTNEWSEGLRYSGTMNQMLFHDGYMMVCDESGRENTVMIISSTGELLYTAIPCKSSNMIGHYAEGLFFAQNGFYDINGNMVIDLSEYDGRIQNMPYFANGRAILVAKNPSGILYEAVIDREGHFLKEFTEQ